MKILFHENQLSYRGTSNAVYNYAHFNEILLGNESVILHCRTNKNNDAKAIEKFSKRFKVLSYNDISEIDAIIENEKPDLFYAIKAGKNDQILTTKCKTAIHTVFKYYEPHGDVYAYVSKWLSNEMTQGKSPFVPHMIYVEKTEKNLKEQLNIPKDAIVFGRHGGGNTFDLKFVKKVIKKVALKRKDLYFLFMGTDQFVFKNFFRPYKNIIFLEKSTDELEISKFINTCDAYLHARKQGESFGIAIGEFSIRNKPVITWANSDEKSHIEILGNKAILYQNDKDLMDILQNFTIDPSKNWDAYSSEFAPEVIMKKFKEVFIDG